jgi:hypothetical protein
LRRFAIAVATVVMGLAAAGIADATTVNTYAASYSFSGGKGTASKPAKLSFKQTITVTPGTAGDRAGILHSITTKIDDVKVDVKGFPTCSASKINAAQDDTGCPKQALVASGYINASLGSPSNPAASAGAACDPDLDVWNGGSGKLVFFFVEQGAHQCLGGALHTGQVGPWTGSYKQAGSNLDVTIPVPNTVDYPLGLNGGQVGSLSKEYLDWKSQSMNGNYDIETLGCSGQRAYTFGFSATALTGGAAQSASTSGKASCG